MNWMNISRAVFIGTASLAYANIYYDDRQYKPFGFR